MSTVSGTSPARSRHRGINRFHPVAIDAQALGLEVIELRQYRQTWVKVMIGLGSVSETKVAQDVRTSGGIWFTDRSEFLRVITSCKTSLARSSRASTWKIQHKYSRFPFQLLISYFVGQHGYQSARPGRHCRLYPRTFHKKFFVQHADELFDREVEGGILCYGWG